MKRINLAVAAALLGAVVLLTGCGGPDHGTVTDKRFDGNYAEWHPGSDKWNCPQAWQKTSGCWTYRAKWELKIRNEDGEDWWEAKEDLYNRVGIGQDFDLR